MVVHIDNMEQTQDVWLPQYVTAHCFFSNSLLSWRSQNISSFSPFCKMHKAIFVKYSVAKHCSKSTANTSNWCGIHIQPFSSSFLVSVLFPCMVWSLQPLQRPPGALMSSCIRLVNKEHVWIVLSALCNQHCRSNCTKSQGCTKESIPPQLLSFCPHIFELFNKSILKSNEGNKI